MQGTKVTVGAPFYNRVAVPIGLFLVFLTGVGPLLPWRAASFKAVKRNFVLPVIALWATVIVCLAVGVRPWKDGALDQGSFYAVVAFAVAAAVLTAIIAEFLRGAGVISRQTHRNLFAATWLLTRRNTRRYGGYIVHIGVVVVVIGLAGSAFNRSIESEMGLHSKMSVGPYTLECMGFTQDTNQNYHFGDVPLLAPVQHVETRVGQVVQAGVHFSVVVIQLHPILGKRIADPLQIGMRELQVVLLVHEPHNVVEDEDALDRIAHHLLLRLQPVDDHPRAQVDQLVRALRVLPPGRS